MPVLIAEMCPILTKDLLKELNNVGIRTVLDFIETNLEEMARTTGLSYKDLTAIRQMLIAQYAAFPVNGTAYYEDYVSAMTILSTGCLSLDKLLCGGFHSGEITELTGQTSTGKTQVCLQTALHTVLNSKHCVLYIDTSAGFCPQWLQDSLENKNISYQTAKESCSRLKCSRVFDVFELLDMLAHTTEQMGQQSDSFYNKLRLIIIDSVAAVISPVIGGQQTEGHGYMVKVATMLKNLAVEHALVVMITNNAVSGDSGGVKPALGKTWQHIPNTRVLVETISKVTRITTVIKSCKQATGGTAKFEIGPHGIQDIANG